MNRSGRYRSFAIRLGALFALVSAFGLSPVGAGNARGEPPSLSAAELAKKVTIYRDAYGVPHINGQDDESTLFGFAYAQAEDFFWQVEDNYILGLGRYAEVAGEEGLNSDLLNRGFEIVSRSQADFTKLEPKLQRLCAAFAEGLNYYLATHPEEEPRLIERFEPWHVLATGRHLALELAFRYTRLSHDHLPRRHDKLWNAAGSNAWVLAPQRTKSGHAILLANPHQPWFGYGQLFEAHLRSGEGWNFIGATVYGGTLPGFGHNEHLGWTFTTNEPDIADVWEETFDDPTQPLAYRYGDGYRQATEWTETIRVLTRAGLSERKHTFRKTHHGPIVANLKGKLLAARVANLYEGMMLRQTLAMVRAQNLEQFRAALELRQFPYMNVLYADREGNTMFVYNGAIPKRDPQFDWSKPVPGRDPRTEWGPLHTLEELPTVLNPSSHYLQNCNSTPFTTSSADNPDPRKFPHYMVEERDDDKRRAKRSREILEGMHGVTLEDVEHAAFDTQLYWARHEMQDFAKELTAIKERDPELAVKAKKYVDHLLDWDGRITNASTQAMLCTAWYEELYGSGYPAEQLKPLYAGNPAARFRGLVRAANRLESLYGSWQTPWGDIHRIQRQPQAADLLTVLFSDKEPSLACLGGHGPMGIVFTQYYTPINRIPWWLTLKKRYGLLGTSYLAVYEFGPKVRGKSLVPFGASGDPESPHFFDQAPLLSKLRLKPELFEWDEVRAAARERYHPGERRASSDPPHERESQ